MTTFEWPGMTVYVELIMHSNNSFGGCASQMHWVPVTLRINETNQISEDNYDNRMAEHLIQDDARMHQFS